MVQQKLQKLPIGIQNFEELRTENYLYVDKTEQLYKLATDGKAYFLSRPRRFGKSMLCSTFRALFEGKKNLFEGTWIGTSDWAWEQYPIIHLSFTSIPHATPAELAESIKRNLLDIALSNSIVLEQGPLGSMLASLIKKLSTPKYKVVLLIDEYDKPLVKNLNDPKSVDEYRSVLKSFYDPIKDCGEFMRFLFITGVSQFSKLSIFSELNHLESLSLSGNAATLCGYTQHEIEHNFNGHLTEASTKFGYTREQMLAEIKQWYNGYCFTIPADAPERVYNPFSILNFFKSNQFMNYWFESGTPTFAIDYFKAHDFSIADFEQVQASQTQLSAMDPSNLMLKTVLYQTGYLTIQSYHHSSGTYSLGFPNHEVAKSCTESLFLFVTKHEMTPLREFGAALRDLFLAGTFPEDKLMGILKSICARIPSTIAPGNEKGYQFMFWMVLQFSGLDVKVEDPTALGRIDAVITTKDHIFVLELKIRGTADQALEQIETKRYAEKFMSTGKPVTCIGAVFDTIKRTMTECKII